MPAGQLRHARQTGSATASYGTELAKIAESEPSFDKLDQSYKKLTALVPVSNTLLRQSGMGIAMIVRDDILRVMALREDIAFLRGDGSANTPTGMRNWASVWVARSTGAIRAIAARCCGWAIRSAPSSAASHQTSRAKRSSSSSGLRPGSPPSAPISRRQSSSSTFTAGRTRGSMPFSASPDWINPQTASKVGRPGGALRQLWDR
ncbi:phage major capsid protein [Mangrovicoccus ximenensis]|uniref:phage major capsid protein n=1 Tax=Mangrovicoccus ximenensis TaxID=1911570 RepID=UPI001F02EB19|nr:phage major capsid protein [Mangrovicoccus ximenensis]